MFVCEVKSLAQVHPGHSSGGIHTHAQGRRQPPGFPFPLRTSSSRGTSGFSLHSTCCGSEDPVEAGAALGRLLVRAAAHLPLGEQSKVAGSAGPSLLPYRTRGLSATCYQVSLPCRFCSRGHKEARVHRTPRRVSRIPSCLRCPWLNALPSAQEVSWPVFGAFSHGWGAGSHPEVQPTLTLHLKRVHCFQTRLPIPAR